MTDSSGNEVAPAITLAARISLPIPTRSDKWTADLTVKLAPSCTRPAPGSSESQTRTLTEDSGPSNSAAAAATVVWGRSGSPAA